ncbi:Transposase (plasmid) [Sodalis glossinidius str. 'morsitans']|uniref:Transposase n=1 Tax=Sodalis glossinidius (strain morsitans) TaxID=343509 RepID=A0A193QPL2_SODGM|nr:transposase [Sodalis glossinidius]CRL46885.1 Transposase [Sodalis glossinidius str. 'morsitans']
MARLARQHGINDNLLFTWRQRYRHLIDIPADHAVGEPIAIDDTLVPVVLKRQLPLLPAASPAPAIPPKPDQVCEVIIGRARLKLYNNQK